ncbi:MAG: response regulator [Deltaproteobacteria bacterium]|nr:response regulator [Deltaproteobacteria bacterium]
MKKDICKDKKVLIIIADDNETFRDAVSFECEMWGCRTVAASNGKEGLESFMKFRNVDLIVSDVRMPEWDGGRFLVELRKISGVQPPFIFMSGFADITIFDALDAGADAFIEKPLDLEFFHNLGCKLLTPISQRWNEEPDEKPVVEIKASFEKFEGDKRFQLGRGGFFVSREMIPSFEQLRANQTVGIDFAFKEGSIRKLQGLGTTAWIRQDRHNELLVGCGIFFEYLDPCCNSHVVDYIKQSHATKTIPKGEEL